ncbi:hypothetical protein GQ54DRAFT_298747 [Martensiomyces pterosporus]|nr:hypothetical protein GQ54DRAFT_298747 [Martensiomyces pterosporus]
MFSNGMRETYEKTVEVWDVTPRAFERMLEYAYTRMCDLDPHGRKPADVSPEEVVETLLCADQFEVAGLRDVCWRNLVSKITTETVWDIWSIATDLEAHDQQRACRNFCCRSFTELCHAPSTMWAPAHLLREVLASDTLNVQSEELLFETVIRWSSFREDSATNEESSPRRSSSVLSAEKYIARSGKISDEAVLKCYRSPSNLSLLPRSPWANHHRPITSPRRKPALTREAFTSGSDPKHADGWRKPNGPTPPLPHAIGSPRLSLAATATKLQSIEYSDSSSPTSSRGCLGSLFERKEFLATLLPCIRFPMMDKNFLLKVVERNADLMAMPVMKDLLIEAYRYHAFNPPPAAPKDRTPNRRSSECYAKKETLAPTTHQAKIILPLNATDELTLSRSQRRKRVHHTKIAIQNIDFA